jgi:hypothetical protein
MDVINSKLHKQGTVSAKMKTDEERKTCPELGGVCNEESCGKWDPKYKQCCAVTQAQAGMDTVVAIYQIYAAMKCGHGRGE